MKSKRFDGWMNDEEKKKSKESMKERKRKKLSDGG